MDFAKQIAGELNLSEAHAEAAIRLIDEGNTIPFIARYRKEATGSMDDQVLRQLGERLELPAGAGKAKGRGAGGGAPAQGKADPSVGGGPGQSRHPGRGGGPVPAPSAPSARPGPAWPGPGGWRAWPQLLKAQKTGTDPEKAGCKLHK